MSKTPKILDIKINTSIPGFQTILFEPSMLKDNYKGNDYKDDDDEVHFYPLIKFNKDVINKTPKELRKKQFFNKGLFESLIKFHGIQPSKTLEEATKEKYIDNNISITLANLFPINNIIYINDKPYVIVDIQYTKGSWKLDKINKKSDNSKSDNSKSYYEINQANKEKKELNSNLLYGSNYIKNSVEQIDEDNKKKEKEKKEKEEKEKEEKEKKEKEKKEKEEKEEKE